MGRVRGEERGRVRMGRVIGEERRIDGDLGGRERKAKREVGNNSEDRRAKGRVRMGRERERLREEELEEW